MILICVTHMTFEIIYCQKTIFVIGYISCDDITKTITDHDICFAIYKIYV